MKTELQTARDLALRAGAVLLKHYAEKPAVKWKGHNDPVTAADIAASRLVVEELRKHFPNDAILSEEEQDDLKRLEHSRVWLVDPMDAMARLHLARALAFAGDAVKAKSAYDDLFMLWKNADPDVPVLEDARAEYARLSMWREASARVRAYGRRRSRSTSRS